MRVAGALLDGLGRVDDPPVPGVDPGLQPARASGSHGCRWSSPATPGGACPARVDDEVRGDGLDRVVGGRAAVAVAAAVPTVAVVEAGATPLPRFQWLSLTVPSAAFATTRSPPTTGQARRPCGRSAPCRVAVRSVSTERTTSDWSAKKADGTVKDSHSNRGKDVSPASTTATVGAAAATATAATSAGYAGRVHRHGPRRVREPGRAAPGLAGDDYRHPLRARPRAACTPSSTPDRPTLDSAETSRRAPATPSTPAPSR